MNKNITTLDTKTAGLKYQSAQFRGGLHRVA